MSLEAFGNPFYNILLLLLRNCLRVPQPHTDEPRRRATEESLKKIKTRSAIFCEHQNGQKVILDTVTDGLCEVNHAKEGTSSLLYKIRQGRE